MADSLSRVAWNARAITDCLHRRLPPTLHHFAERLSTDLLDAFVKPIAPPRAVIAQCLADNTTFQRIHRHCIKHNTWPVPDLHPPKMQPLPAFADLNIPQFATLSDLADWLLLTPAQLDYYADPTGRHEEHGDMAVNHYHYHLTQKASGGHRLIEAPKPRLKSLQRLILRAILDQIPVHANAYGFVPGRNCIDAAARHVGEAVVIAFDLRDFFPSIQGGRVYGVFRALGYPPLVAQRLTGLCANVTPARIRDRFPFPQRQTMRVGHLPQGAPTSPALANLASYRLDGRLAGLARSLGATYTRYADDLTFSGDAHIQTALLCAVPTIATEEGFALNPTKTRVMPSRRRQVVTGIVVNAKTNVDRRDYDRLKAVIHAGHWAHDPTAHAQLIGQIGWVAQLNPAKGARLRELLAGPRAEA